MGFNYEHVKIKSSFNNISSTYWNQSHNYVNEGEVTFITLAEATFLYFLGQHIFETV